MEKISYFLVFLWLITHSYAQDIEFGKISEDDLNLEVYTEDPDAEALILFDIGKSYFDITNKGFVIRFTRTKRVKILRQEGKKYADVSIPLYIGNQGKEEKVTSIIAHTFNKEGGKIVKKALEPENVYEEQLGEHLRAKKFALPAVEAGSIIEYRYELVTPFYFNLPDWYFQDKIPTLYSEYTVKMVPFYDYVFLAKGLKKFDLRESNVSEEARFFAGVVFNDIVHRYVMKDISAFRDETFITNPEDHIQKIDFQLSKVRPPNAPSKLIMTTWAQLSKDLLNHESFGGYMDKCAKEAKKILGSEIQIDDKDALEKSRIIIEYVRANFKWDGNYSKYASKKAKDFLEQKTGNSADINLFLIALLREAKVSVDPIILSTRNHGKVSHKYPFVFLFNYVALVIRTYQRDFLTDGTTTHINFDRLPIQCLNELAYIVDLKGSNWINLNKNTESVNSKVFRIAINIDESIAKTSTMIQSSNYEAFQYKSEYLDDPKSLENLALKHGYTDVESVNTQNYKQTDKSYNITFKGNIDIEKLGDKLFVNPFLEFPIQNNPFKQKKRSYPIDFTYIRSEKLRSTIFIPKGYKALELPEDFKMINDLVTLIIKYGKTDRSIIVHAVFTLKKSIYQPDEYSQIKECFEVMVNKFNEAIILEEIKNE